MRTAAKRDQEKDHDIKTTKASEYAANITTPSAPRANSATVLIALQASSRIFTMLFAQLQVRLTSAEVFGVAHIQLELLLGTMLTLSREGIRNALSRNTTTENAPGVDEAREASIRNVALIPLPVGMVVSTACMLLYRNVLAPKELVWHPHFGLACNLFLAGVALELLSEPMYVAAMRAQHRSPRVLAEGMGTIAKGASTLATLLYLMHYAKGVSVYKQSLLPFGVGQLCFGLVVLAVFLADSLHRAGLKETLRLYTFQTASGEHKTLNAEAVKLSTSLSRQSVVKHLLGEADKFAVARLTSLSEQGAYALASNYASIVARILYQPIEESARLTFAATLGSTNAKRNDRRSLQQGQALLHTLLAFYVLLAVSLMAFCPPLTTPLLVIVAGQRWAVETSAPRFLAAYGATYLPVMAFNGLLEGFLQACASSVELARYDGILLGASVVYVIAVVCITSGGWLSAETGLIFASSVSSLIRAAYSFRFATRFLRSQTTVASSDGQDRREETLTVASLMPSRVLLSYVVVSGSIFYSSNSRLSQSDWRLPWQRHAMVHILLSLPIAFGFALMCWICERKTLYQTLKAIGGRRLTK